MNPTSPQSTVPNQTAEAQAATPPASNKSKIIALVAGLVVLVLALIIGYFVLQPPKPTAANHFKAYWHLLGIEHDFESEDISGIKTPGDLIKSVYNPDFHFDAARDNFADLLKEYTAASGDMERLLGFLDADARNIQADKTSYDLLTALLPTLKKQAANYVQLQKDMEAGRDVLPKIAIYSIPHEHPLYTANTARLDPQDVISTAKKTKADVETLKTQLDSFKPTTDFFKSIKQHFEDKYEGQIALATLLAASDGSKGAVVQFGSRAVEDMAFDSDALDTKLDEFIGNVDDYKKLVAVAQKLASYIKTDLGVAPSSFDPAAIQALDTVKADLGDSTYRGLLRAYGLE